jgi:hypothetical protein
MQIRPAPAALLTLVLSALAFGACSEIPPETPEQRALDACQNTKDTEDPYDCSPHDMLLRGF